MLDPEGTLRSMVSLDAQPVPVTPDDIEAAAQRIGDRVRRTPVIDHDGITLKLELLQHAGSFKTRGAFNRVLSEPELPAAGIIAASGGNHGAAVAYVGCRARARAPRSSSRRPHRTSNATNIERFGATVRVIEGFYDDAQAAANDRRAERARSMIHPYDHPATVAGQGTMARELADQVGGVDTLLVAAGGGGFIAGQAAWFRDDVRIVERRTRDLAVPACGARCAGEPVDVPVSGVAADSLGARRSVRCRGRSSGTSSTRPWS